MAFRYMVLAFCDACAMAHPTGICIEREGLLSSSQCLAEVYTSEALPDSLAGLAELSFRCPDTGLLYLQTDMRQLFYSAFRRFSSPPRWL